MSDDNPGAWTLFLGGKFKPKKPRAPGLYPLRGADGGGTDPRQWRYVDEAGREYVFRALGHGEPGWQGEWYDRPVPPVRS